MLSSGSRGGDCPAGAKPWKDRGAYHLRRRALLVPYITKSLNPDRLLSGSSLWRALARLVVTALLVRRLGKTLVWVVLRGCPAGAVCYSLFSVLAAVWAGLPVASVPALLCIISFIGDNAFGFLGDLLNVV